MPGRFAALAVLGGILAGLPAAARAENVADFYKDKQITFFVGSEAGGSYDAYARLVARHYARHIPGSPSIITKNMAGAGSLTMMNHIANVAPKDGTALGMPQNNVPMEKLLHIVSPGGEAAHFDAQSLNWIGSAARDVFLLVAWHTARAQRFEDLKSQELIVGSAGPNTDHSIMARLLNEMFGTKLKVVTGYSSSTEVMAAIEKGEVEGNAGRSYASLMSGYANWVRDGKIRILVQLALTPHPALKDVPSVLDFVETPEQRSVLELILSKNQMSRLFFAAAGVPAERIAALRRGFDDTMRDPAFLADAALVKLEIDPVSGIEVQDLVTELYRTPDAVVARARAILGTD